MTVSTYMIVRTVVNTEQGEVRAVSLEDAWELWHAEGRDLLSPHYDDQEVTVQIVEDTKDLPDRPTVWDMKSCPGCGSSRGLDVEEAVGHEGTYELFTVMSNCCAVQWMVDGLEMAAACDPAWKDVG
tara:strand:- start:72 stop:452 length:381 start_codon:yes stop_codon:yes gene_type:complete